MKYFHRTHLAPDEAVRLAADFFGGRLSPVEEGGRRRRWSSPLGQLGVTVQAEGGHYTLVTVETDQPGESELDKLGKRFLTMLHTAAEPSHRPIGAY